MDAKTTPSGERLYVDRDDPELGSVAPFYPAYRTVEGGGRWGYFCSNCGGFDTAMDTMGRIVCNDCSNLRKPTEWDAVEG